MKYTMTIQAEFEAEDYTSALSSAAEVASTLSNSVAIKVNDVQFKPAHTATVSIRDTGARVIGSGLPGRENY